MLTASSILTTLSQPFPDLPDSARIVKVMRTLDIEPAMIIDCSRNPRKQDQGYECQDAMSREASLQDSMHPDRLSSI
ncbi:unnamed protein product [Lasius platythorax]|uniref:Uncharacterized protein n=1 Tax=Lasius platythorax TaxID=488582 RepID=A0AAV2P411_9HYME